MLKSSFSGAQINVRNEARNTNQVDGGNYCTSPDIVSHERGHLMFHKRTASSGIAPTRGEFQIMRHLGEEAYSQMKAMRSSHQPQKFQIQLNEEQTKLTAAGSSTRASKLSRPITSTTKPSNSNYQSYNMFLTKNNSAQTTGRSMRASKNLKRCATGGGGRIRDSKRPWHRHASKISSLDISSTQHALGTQLSGVQSVKQPDYVHL